jgi:hypothetical protein
VNPRVREWLGATLAVVLAVLAGIAVTWPMINYLDRVVLGGGELGGWLWRFDWHYQELDALVASQMGPLDTWIAFVGLGRYPETGNILDVLLLSYPLDRLIGFPSSYNVKILVILALNGLCGYAAARYFSGSVAAALAASAIAVVNPIDLFEIQACGLRQTILWWVLLYPALLDLALRRRSLWAGFAAGACLGLAGDWYWFYGLFAAIFTGLWSLRAVWNEWGRVRWRSLLRTGVGVGLGVLVAAGPFVLAYLVRDTGGDPAQGSEGGAGRPLLPEMTFFLPFPSYDTISHSPMRPETYAENVLASINRTIGSSWSLTFPVDPRLNEALPLTVVAFGVVPALVRRRAWAWLGVWTFFYVGALGPFLRIGVGDNRAVLRVFEDYVVRMPYTLMFQFIPGMSRMFAPYRLVSMVVVASVVLVATGLARLRWRAWLAPVVILLTVLQPLYRWGRGSVNEGDADSRELRSPIKANRIRVPTWYLDIDPAVAAGIVELPLEQQQDLTCYYQILHKQKVFKSWASPGALPPFLRSKGKGGEAGERLRYLATPDVLDGPIPEVFDALSKQPDTADLGALTVEGLLRWAKAGKYTRIVVHERGYFLVDPTRGARLFQSAVDRLSTQLAVAPTVLAELRKGDPAHPEFGVPIVGDLVPWTSQPAELPPERAPDVFKMAVIDLASLVPEEKAELPSAAPTPDETPTTAADTIR